MWPSMPLASAVQYRKGFIQIDDLETYKRCRVQLHAQGIVLRDTVPGAEIKTKKQQVCKAGDFLVAEIDAKVGGFGIVPDILDGSIVSSHYFLFEVNDNVLNRRFLDFFIRTPAFREQVAAQGSTNYAAIRPNDVLGYKIPLPPLPEQRRIVARIESLAARTREAIGLGHQTKDESEALVHANRNQVFRELHSQYSPERLDSVAACRLGKMLDPRFKTGIGSTPYLRNANIQWDRLDLSEVYQMDFTEEERIEFVLETDDILVCEGGDIGKAALWGNEIPGCCYQKALHRIRCNRERIIPRFILHHLFWAAHEGHWHELKTQTTIPHLTGVKLKAYKVCVPPLSEQRRIVDYLDGLHAKVDALKKLQAETAAELAALLPSVLDKAFKGEL
jgi:type I restriction enzyme S subunit